MGLIIDESKIEMIEKISKREKSPFYVVGEVTEDNHLTFKSNTETPFDLDLDVLFGSSPKTELIDETKKYDFEELNYDQNKIQDYIKSVLKLESVACKDWLTNKVDRSVTGRVVKQQNCGIYHLPLNNYGITSLDYESQKGIVNSIGHSPISGLIDEEAGSRLSVGESLTNIVFAPLTYGLSGISLSANWMWPAKNKGENVRLYNAVKSLSDFVIDLGINVPTGKDSLSMKQKYEDGDVLSPGTVIVSAVGECDQFELAVEPVLKSKDSSLIVWVDFSDSNFNLGGSSFAQILTKVGKGVPDISDPKRFVKTFNIIQDLVRENKILSGHDVGSGGLITTLLEMCFSTENLGMNLMFDSFEEKDLVKILFSEQPSVVIQIEDRKVLDRLRLGKITHKVLGVIRKDSIICIDRKIELDVKEYMDYWFETSYLFDKHQNKLALERYQNYKKQPLTFKFPDNFDGTIKKRERNIKAAIIREKGVNGDREMAYSLWKA
ncbi:phosphoribosylformylglycinamidine synthase, partial [bacterium]|nr:phosphoribosylformylglycinamidine synthase [bacterium]